MLSPKSSCRSAALPLLTGLKLLATIAVCELLIMVLFDFLQIDNRFPPLLVGVMDSLALSIISATLIYFWVFRPMKTAEEFKCIENELRDSERKYRRLFETSRDGIMVIAHDSGAILNLNPAMLTMFGGPAAEYFGKPFWQTTPFRHGCTDEASFREFREKVFENCEMSLRTGDDRQTVVECLGNIFQDDLGKVIQVTIRDISERKRAELELLGRSRQAALAAEVGAALIKGNDLRGMLQCCTESIVSHLDAAFARIWTVAEGETTLELQASAGLYTHLDGPHGRIPIDDRLKIGRIAHERKAHLTNAVLGDPQVGDQEWAKREGMIAFAGHPLVVGEKLVGVMAMFAKIPLGETSLAALRAIADEIALGIEQKTVAKQVNFLAYYDYLTGLANRNYFVKQLGTAIEYAARYQKRFAVAMIDLDDFKRINDTLGHTTGDELLRQVARRLQDSLRKSDLAARTTEAETESLARLGGDEFIVLLRELDQPRDTGQLAWRLLRELAEPFALEGREIFITASIGLATFPEDGDSVVELIKNADTALYQAKSSGKNTCQFYSESMNKTALELLTMEADLHRALDRQELLLYYQPKMDLLTRKIIGSEALVRWNHPEKGLIPPGKFIPLAESNGLIVPIGEWVLRTACRQLKAWEKMGLGPQTVAVNVSGRQFGQADLIEKVFSALADADLDPQLLELEITETTIMQDPDGAIRVLKQLQEAGIRISIDDFGTGYSSLNYLKQLPLDTLKIDLSFIRNVVTNADDAAIVKTIIAMAHGLELKVIAEGVEDERQLEFLRNHDCDLIQGYWLSPPVPPEKFPGLL